MQIPIIGKYYYLLFFGFCLCIIFEGDGWMRGEMFDYKACKRHPDQTNEESFRVSLRVVVIGESFRVSFRVHVIEESFCACN